MAFDVSELARPLHITNVSQLASLSDTELERIALGAPIAFGELRYCFVWDKAYARADLKRLFSPSSPTERDRCREKVLRVYLQSRLRDHLTRDITRSELAPGPRSTHAFFRKQAAIEHVAAGGLLRVQDQACRKHFTVVLDKAGNARWKAVGKCRWWALAALHDFLARLTRSGREARRSERDLLRELRSYMPADDVKRWRREIDEQRKRATGSVGSTEPCVSDTDFLRRMASPHAVMQFLRYDSGCLEYRDDHRRTVAHHVALNKQLQAAPVLDRLFQRVAIAAAAGGWYRSGEQAKGVTPVAVMDRDGNTPVHYAVRSADRKTVQRFLNEAMQFRFDFASQCNTAGQTVWDVAQERGDPEVAAIVTKVAKPPPSGYGRLTIPPAP